MSSDNYPPQSTTPRIKPRRPYFMNDPKYDGPEYDDEANQWNAQFQYRFEPQPKPNLNVLYVIIPIATISVFGTIYFLMKMKPNVKRNNFSKIFQ